MTGVDAGPTNDADGGTNDTENEGGSGLSTGASAGIGVGVGVAGLALLAAIFFLLRRRKQKSAKEEEAAAAAAAATQNHYARKEQDHRYEEVEETPANYIYEAPTKDTGAREIEGLTPIRPQTAPMELDSAEVPTPTRSPV